MSFASRSTGTSLDCAGFTYQAGQHPSCYMKVAGSTLTSTDGNLFAAYPGDSGDGWLFHPKAATCATSPARTAHARHPRG